MDDNDISGDASTHYNNSYTVVSARSRNYSIGSSTILDGFTIKAGYGGSQGGGIFLRGASPVISNCKIEGNHSGRAGGVFTSDGSPQFMACVFSENTADNEGGGVGIRGGSPQFMNCTFSDNEASSTSTTGGNGGGVVFSGGSPQFRSCTFSNNKASTVFDINGSSGGNGGAIYGDNYGNVVIGVDPSTSTTGPPMATTTFNCIFNGNTSTGRGGAINLSNASGSITSCKFTGNGVNVSLNSSTINGGAIELNDSDTNISHCYFEGNSAEYGGAIYNEGDLPDHLTTIDKCTFKSNTATKDGGGIKSWEESHLNVSTCIFLANTAEDGGGISSREAEELNVYNSLFIGNIADCTLGSSTTHFATGGAIYNDNTSNASFINCTLTNNTADNGAAMANAGAISPVITNCILYGNILSSTPMVSADAEIYNRNGSTPVITYSIVQGATPDATNHIHDTAPGFVGTPSITDFANAQLSPSPSPVAFAKDKGNDSALLPASITTDLAGNPRKSGTIDIGAYEVQ